MQDSEIIELYFARDERAITETSGKYGAYCQKIAVNILSDTFDAEECVSDTYMRVWNTIPPSRPNIFRAFLARITRNLAIDRYNARNAEKRGGRVAESLDELSECIGSSDITEQMESADIAKVINKFLEGERKLVRIIFVRRYFYEDSIRDISHSMGIGESHTKTILYRARQKLSLLLQKEGIFI